MHEIPVHVKNYKKSEEEGISMSVITTLKERRYEKQLRFERKVLRELSLEGLKVSVGEFFYPFFYCDSSYMTAIEEGSIDMALEAYLLGASYSRLGHYGEPIEHVRQRSREEEKYLVDALFDYLQYWELAAGNDFKMESLHLASEQFIDHWWSKGFKNGEIRYKMRLH